MENKYEEEILNSLHETALGLRKIGVISEKEMQEYDQNCNVQNPKTGIIIDKTSEMKSLTA